MRTEDYARRRIELDGWPVNVTSYKIGNTFYAQADNVSPGAVLARASANTREDAEKDVVEHARKLLARTRVHTV